MNLEQLRKEIEADEGCRYDIYLDHLGYPTFGIGHLISKTDPEHGAEVGTSVSEARVIQAFNTDMGIVLDDCNTLYEDFETLPEEVQHIIANMMFNLGRPRLSKFKKFNAALELGDWTTAGVEGRDSLWHRQVGNRAERLMKRLENV